MAEVNASSPEQKQEAGAVMGRALYHALDGRCILSRALPNESFFLDYMMSFLGPENFTAMGKHPSGRSTASGRAFTSNVVFGLHRSEGSDEEPEPGSGDWTRAPGR